MENKFALAVENSTASFISNQKLIAKGVDYYLQNTGCFNAVILCEDLGWFTVGKKIKDELSLRAKVVSFCVEQDCEYHSVLPKLFESVQKADEIIVIANQNFALFACEYYKNKKVKVVFIPLDFDFCEFFALACGGENCALVLCEKLLSLCSRNKTTDALRMIYSRQIISAEMLANEVIGGHIANNEAQKLLDESILCAEEYLTKRYLYLLCIALLKGSVAEQKSGVGNIPFLAGKILYRMQNLSLKGEREYLLYKMTLRLYKLYFSNECNFLINLPGRVLEEEEIKGLFKFDYQKHLSSLPYFFNDLTKVDEIKEKIIAKGKFLPVVDKLLSKIESESLALKKEYGGRKYSVEHYSSKQRAKALYLAPYINGKPTAYDLLFASGVTQFLKQ